MLTRAARSVVRRLRHPGPRRPRSPITGIPPDETLGESTFGRRRAALRLVRLAGPATDRSTRFTEPPLVGSLSPCSPRSPVDSVLDRVRLRRHERPPANREAGRAWKPLRAGPLMLGSTAACRAHALATASAIDRTENRLDRSAASTASRRLAGATAIGPLRLLAGRRRRLRHLHRRQSLQRAAHDAAAHAPLRGHSPPGGAERRWDMDRLGDQEDSFAALCQAPRRSLTRRPPVGLSRPRPERRSRSCALNVKFKFSASGHASRGLLRRENGAAGSNRRRGRPRDHG